MAWEYLQKTELDGRYLVASGYLANKLAGKDIVELNCGTSRILDYLPDTYKSYLGNDINPDYLVRKSSKIKLLNIPDDEFVTKVERADICLYFGHGYGEVLRNEHESPTSYDSFIQLVDKTRPEYVVLEGNSWYEQQYNRLAAFVATPALAEKYGIEQAIELSPLAYEHQFAIRRVYIMRRKTN